MTLRKILLPVSGRKESESAAKVAFVLAARYGAKVEGLHPATPVMDQFAIQDEAGAALQYQRLLEQMQKEARKDKERARARFMAWGNAHPSIKTTFLALDGDAGNSAAHRGRLSDLTVMPKASKKESRFNVDVREAALFHTGRPLIVAPEKKISPDLGETIVIAWKESVEAARAVSAALPLLPKANAVHIISAGSDRRSMKSLAEIKKYIALHFPAVTAKMITGRRDVGAVLIQQAARKKGALLVMGAYSQWRLKEWVFGGVTRYVLHETSLPVLMAH